MDQPAPPYKGFLMFRDKRNPRLPYGWKESLWIKHDSLQASLKALEEIAEPRLALLPKGFMIERLQVTNPLVPRACVDNFHYHQAGRYEKEARPAWELLLLRLQHDCFSTRYNLSGLPVDVTGAMGIHPSPEWQTAFDEFAAALKRHCVMVNEVRDRPQNRLARTMGNVTPEGATLRLTTAEDFFDAADVRQKMRIKVDATEPLWLNGTFDVVVVDSRTAHFVGEFPNVAGGPVAIRKQQKLVHPISSITILRVSSRKRGYGHDYPRPGRR